jgi:ABC-2 type transport system ATP-binding protein
MCLGLIAPTAGSVEILGRDVALDGARVLPHVGALVEQPALYPYMSGRDNLRAIGAALGGVSPARLDAVLDVVDLRSRARDRVRTYSLGMKQRLGVAIALLQDPDLLILDEPTNGLDPAGMVEMRDLLRRLAAEGKTIFVSSHVLGEIQHICTRVAIIARGRLVTESTVAALTGGQGEFVVTMGRPQQAQATLALLRAQAWGANARMETSSGGHAGDPTSQLITPAPKGQSADLNVFLVQAGFAPTSITPYAQDLEAVFLRLTEDATDDGASAAQRVARQATTGGNQ